MSQQESHSYEFGRFRLNVAERVLLREGELVPLTPKVFDILLVLVIGGSGYLFGGIIGAVIFTAMHHWLSAITPQYWMFWIGLVLVVIVLIGRERIHRWVLWGPNLVIRQVFGRKAVVGVPGSDPS